MKLYYSPGACSLASNIVLQETGLNHTLEPVNLKTHHFKGGDYYKVNPKGYVPALDLGNGEVLTEGVAIMQYVSDQKPESGLMPKAGTFERYRAQEWLTFISSEIHKTYAPLWQERTPAETKTMIKESLAKRFDFLTDQLKSRPFLMGDKFTAPDAYLFTILGWSNYTGIELAKWPTLMGYMERVTARPAVQAAMKAEGLLK